MWVAGWFCVSTDQTLEPTQVAGFNQFYDDFNGTEAWKYGAAVDQKFSASIYGGVEFSYGDLETSPASASGGADQFDWREYLARAYLYWTPHKWIALRTAYEFERFERDKGFTDGIKNMNSQRVPLGLGFFHPSGLGASLQLTYVSSQRACHFHIVGLQAIRAFQHFVDDDGGYVLLEGRFYFSAFAFFRAIAENGQARIGHGERQQRIDQVDPKPILHEQEPRQRYLQGEQQQQEKKPWTALRRGRTKPIKLPGTMTASR